MRNWKKSPNFIKGTCYLLAGTLAVSSVVIFGGGEMEVSAAKNTLPGIEQLREEYIANTKTYRILEIVPEIGQAEIGYYVGGQEPFDILYEEEGNAYIPWQELLLTMENWEEREAFMQELCRQAQKVNSYYKETGQELFAVSEYKEYAPGSQPEDATEIKIDGDVKRGYLEYASGEWDAVFTVLPDRDMSLDEVIYSVTTPYYQAMNVETSFSYEELKSFAEENPMEELYILRPEGHLEYMGSAGEVWEETSIYLEKLIASVSGNDVSSGNSTVSGGNSVEDIWQESSGFFHPYFSLISPENPVLPGGQIYLMSEAEYRGEAQGHYQLVETIEREQPGEGFSYEATYLYFTGGVVNNEIFKKEVFGLEQQECNSFRIEVETVTPAMLKGLFEEKKITSVMEGAELFAEYNFVYINGGAAMTEVKGVAGNYSTENDITPLLLGALGMYISVEKIPCIFDLQPFVEATEWGYSAKDTTAANVSNTYLGRMAFFLYAPAYAESGDDIKEDFYWSWGPNLGSLTGSMGNLDFTNSSNETCFGSDYKELVNRKDADTVARDCSFVKDNVWFVHNEPSVTGEASLENRGLFSDKEYALEQIKAGFLRVYQEIGVENMYLAEQQEELLDTRIYDASVFRYIINFCNQRQLSKNSLDVLVIEPAGRTSSLSAEDFSYLTGIEAGKITFHVMAMNEFVGRIEDLNATYDIIYFDADTSNLPTVDGETVYNDSSMNGLLYSHVGDSLEAYAILSGLLDTDYTDNVRNSTLKETTMHRYSGNDLSVEKYNSLKDYLEANYPIVISSELLTAGGTQVDARRVDNSSYLYEFLNEILADKARRNIFVSDELSEKRSAFAFYANRPKLSLYSPEYEDLIMTRELYSLSDGTQNPNVTRISSVDGRYYLQFDFIIENDSAADFGDDYTCKLYLDSNADGKFSEEYEELSLSGGSIVNVNTGQSVGDVSQLKTGVRYQVSREVPDSFHGCITWQLEVSQTGCPSIRTQRKGYTKLSGGEVAHIKILQIYYHDTGRYIDLEQSIGHFENGDYVDIGGNVTNYFREVARNVKEDYVLDIKTIHKSVFESGYFDGEAGLEPINLNDFDMLILGFSDGKDSIDWNCGVDTSINDIPNNTISHFIESGKSVLFAHDMTSYTNVPDASILIGSSLGEEYRIANNENRALRDYYYETDKNGSWVWGYDINIKLRNLVGMDTFGISSGVNKGVLQPGNGFYQTQIQSDEVTKIVYQDAGGKATLSVPYKNTEGKYVYGVQDVAFAPNSARKSTLPQVQGFTAYILNRQVYNNGNVNFYRTGLGVNRSNTYSYKAEKVNDGQITNYPYLISQLPALAETHQQYYTLDLNSDNDKDGETDIVVWYNLAGGLYDMAPGDVKNNYYIYSKGNVIYTGMGHAATKKSNSINPYLDAVTLEEAKLFINTMIAAYNAGQRSPQIVTMNSGGIATDVVYNYDDPLITNAEDRVEVFFRVDDLNITQGTKEVELHYYMELTADDTRIEELKASGYNVLAASQLPDAGSEFPTDVVLIEVTELLLPANTYTGNDTVSVQLTEKGYLQPEMVYRVEIPLGYFAADVQGYRSSFYIGGRTVMTHSSIIDGSKVASYTPYVYAQVQCMNVELFDLD